MVSFPWAQHLNLNRNPNWQVKTFHETFLDIISNFIPNDVKNFTPRDSPWISHPLKTLLRKKDRLYRNYKRHGLRDEDKNRLDNFRKECQEAIESAKLTYLKNLGNKLNEPDTTPKNYWKIIHRVINKSRAPKIPPILSNGKFILSCADKAKLFNEFFSNHCTLI